MNALNNPSNSLKQQLQAEIEMGIALSADPANAGLPDLAIRMTTMNSPWFARTCRVCSDKFREGDQVRLCPKCGEPYHDDNQYGLHCWDKNFAAGGICKGGQFDDRFDETGENPPGCGFSCHQQPAMPKTGMADNGPSPISRIEPPEQLIKQFLGGLETVWSPFGEQTSIKVQPHSSLVGRKCPWCRFSIRAGDWVVACPCGTGCGTFFHQDMFRHLTCWNEWNGIEGNNYCPNTGAAYPQAAGRSVDG